jgi:TRAP-type mannitol/chloroaromatic compound transport system permease small subunit
MTTQGVVPANGIWTLLLRLFAWGTVTVTFAYLFEVWAIFWRDMPGMLAGGVVATGGYAAAAALAVALSLRGQRGPLRDDSARISAISGYVARAAFWMVLLIGLADAAISLARIEGWLPALVGPEMATLLGQSAWRGPYVHMPLALVGLVLGLLTRGVSFVWLALLVVIIQLLIVIGRFIFSYEQAFLSDLVRMWYAALFLFASAFTLAEEGHVRVDIFFASMSRRGKALINGLGSVLLGMTMMWTILILGTRTSASTITGPFLRFEQGQQTFGMMTKYWMAIFLGIFAVTMMLQFASYVLKAGADWRGEHDPHAVPEGTPLPAVG